MESHSWKTRTLVEAREELPAFDARSNHGREIPCKDLIDTDNCKTPEWLVIESREAFVSTLSRTCGPQISFSQWKTNSKQSAELMLSLEFFFPVSLAQHVSG